MAGKYLLIGSYLQSMQGATVKATVKAKCVSSGHSQLVAHTTCSLLASCEAAVALLNGGTSLAFVTSIYGMVVPLGLN